MTEPGKTLLDLQDLAAAVLKETGSLDQAVAAVVAEHTRRLGAELAHMVVNAHSMTNTELAGLKRLEHVDPLHEECGEVFVAYAARVVRDLTGAGAVAKDGGS